jgi:hypothetical protein
MIKVPRLRSVELRRGKQVSGVRKKKQRICNLSKIPSEAKPDELPQNLASTLTLILRSLIIT